MVEFAIVAPLLFLIIFGIIELGLVISVYVGLTNSAREAARAGATWQYADEPPMMLSTTDCQKVMHLMDAGRKAYIDAVLSQTMNPIVDTNRFTSTVSYRSDDATELCRTNFYDPFHAGRPLTVTLEYQHELFFGVFGQNKQVIRANSAMRIEPNGVPAGAGP